MSSRHIGEETSERKSTHLPDDSDTYLPAVARHWLSKYSLTEHELINNKLLWSESKQQLLFPYFDKYDNLVAYQARNFKDGHKAKWVSYGKMDKLYHILPIKEAYNNIILVEDIVSAIVVSRHTPCMPLFGSQISVERFVCLSKLCTSLSIWLDYDKRSEAVKFSRRSLVPCNVIITEKDPKGYSNEEVKGILYGDL